MKLHNVVMVWLVTVASLAYGMGRLYEDERLHFLGDATTSFDIVKEQIHRALVEENFAQAQQLCWMLFDIAKQIEYLDRAAGAEAMSQYFSFLEEISNRTGTRKRPLEEEEMSEGEESPEETGMSKRRR